VNVARTSSDRGSATIVTVGFAVALALVGAAAVTGTAVSSASARAQGTADLAALAAATNARDARALGRPHSDHACSLARDVAHANAGSVVTCTVGPHGVVHVEIAVAVTGGLAPLTVTRSADAGPSSARR
jgi:secretion/DNA translocation related TadE-like protein